MRRKLRTAGAAPSDALRTAREELLHARSAAARAAAGRLAVRLVLPLGACFLPAFVLVGLAPVLIALGIDLLSG
jgi:pilus assembly protein TadC